MTGRLDRWLGLSGCLLALESACGGELFPAAQTSQFYTRATNQFGAADFYKPAVTTNTGLAFELVPLIMQEVDWGGGRRTNEERLTLEARERDARAGGALSGTDRFGLGSLPEDVLALDQAPRGIYEYPDVVELNGKSYVRSTYIWFYAGEGRQRMDAGLRAQGVRITLNSRGQPAIWEVLADTSAARLVFVSRSLEAAAEAEFGKPLPGRRYAIERPVAEAPKVIVPRVIEDGPMAMGPIVYLQAGTHDVSTVICRCMPAQAKALLATSDYRLVPFASAAAQLGLMRERLTKQGRAVLWPGGAQSDHCLEKLLRLPAAL
jgi:hypothetical protein